MEAKAKVVESREKKRKLARNGPSIGSTGDGIFAKTQSITLKKEGVRKTSIKPETKRESRSRLWYFASYSQSGGLALELK